MQKEIGSNFDLDPKILLQNTDQWDLSKIEIIGEDTVLLSTGRSAEGLILDEIECRNPKIKKTALIPPFTCHTVIEPFLKRGYAVKAYSIDKHLRIDPEIFEKELYESEARVVLIHQYFGFPTAGNIQNIIEKAVKRGTIFIEDKTQCLYSSFPVLPVQYVMGSLRKWAALPDGGFAVSRQGKFHKKPEAYDSKLEKEKIEAAEDKYKYLHEDQGEKQNFLNKFQLAEHTLDAQKEYFKICPSSIKIQANLNTERLKKKRRENYEHLYERLVKSRCMKVLTSFLQEEEVPLYCICLTENREVVQTYLRENRIYAPIVWPKPEVFPLVCEEVEELYEKSLCIPIDQRYDIDDMDRVLCCIKEIEDRCR